MIDTLKLSLTGSFVLVLECSFLTQTYFFAPFLAHKEM